MFIHLKTKLDKNQRLEDQRFAILIEPDFTPTPKVSPKENDNCLLACIKEHGWAVIHQFEKDNPFILEPEPTTLTPGQFEKEWIGD